MTKKRVEMRASPQPRLERRVRDLEADPLPEGWKPKTCDDTNTQ